MSELKKTLFENKRFKKCPDIVLTILGLESWKDIKDTIRHLGHSVKAYWPNWPCFDMQMISYLSLEVDLDYSSLSIFVKNKSMICNNKNDPSSSYFYSRMSLLPISWHFDHPLWRLQLQTSCLYYPCLVIVRWEGEHNK